MGKLAQFFGNYAVVKKNQAFTGIISSIVNFDLDGASEADLMSYEQNLDKLTVMAAEAKDNLKVQRDEATAIVEEYNTKLAGINILKEDYATETNETEKADIEQTIRDEVTALRALEPEVAREKQEALDAEVDYNELKELATASRDALIGARKAIENSRKSVERSERAIEREKIRVDRAAALKGLTDRVSNVSVALESMNKQAKENQIQADALRMKADLLGGDKEKKSDRMKDAMARATGKGSVATENIDDLLGGLKPM